MSAETVFYNLLGVKLESKQIKWSSVAFFEAFSKLDRVLHQTRYSGAKLAESGPLLVVSNHSSIFDVAKGYRIGQLSHRIVSIFVRATILDPNKKDSERVKTSTGNKKDILNNNWGLLRKINSAILLGVGAKPVMRGAGRVDLEEFKLLGKEGFDDGLALGISTQQSRQKDGSLAKVMRGPEILASENPDILIYPVGISGRGFKRFFLHRVVIGLPFTYNEAINDPDQAELARTHFTVYLNDKIADLLDEEKKQDWYENHRSKLLNRKRTA